MMGRIPEPELMDDPEHARAYSGANFEEAHSLLVGRLRSLVPELGEGGCILDLGCGPGDVTVRLADAYPGTEIVAVDGSSPMLELARERIQGRGLADRIDLRLALIGDLPVSARPFDLIVSTSLLHHLGDPAVLWSAIRRHGAAGSRVYVADLRRPDSRAAAERIVAEESAGEPEPLRTDFLNSLLAAYSPSEVSAQLETGGLGSLIVETLGERHLVVHGSLPGDA